MNQHIKKVTDNYPESLRDRVIHPISELDAQLVIELYEIFKKFEFQPAIDILKNYKTSKDEDIVLDLFELNTSLASQLGSIQNPFNQALNEKLDIVKYIEINGEVLNVEFIHTFKKIDVFGKPSPYCILVNELPDKDIRNVPFYANKYISFNYEEDRDELYDKLKELFKQLNGKFLGNE